MAANFASGVVPCAGIVEPFNHPLHIIAHPQILSCERPWAFAWDNAVFVLLVQIDMVAVV